jgi:hypothetical protein
VGSALQLLLAQPSSKKRVIGAVEAAALPAQIFFPLVPGALTSRDEETVNDLVEESVLRSSQPGGLRDALEVADKLNPDTRSAIVIAGRDARWTAGPAPRFVTDVIGVRVRPGSPAERSLEALASSSGGDYARATPNDVQAQVALFDARRRCERPIRKARIRAHRASDPNRVSTLATDLESGYELDASATTSKYTDYVDLVVTWTSPEETVKPYELTVSTLRPGKDLQTKFTAAEVHAAAGGQPITNNGISLTGGAGDTFIALRVDFRDEDRALSRLPQARIAYHNKHHYHFGGGNRPSHAYAAADSVRVYTQFFRAKQRPPG